MNYPRTWMNGLNNSKRPYDIEYRDFYMEMINLDIFISEEPKYSSNVEIIERSISEEFWVDCLKRHGIL